MSAEREDIKTKCNIQNRKKIARKDAKTQRKERP